MERDHALTRHDLGPILGVRQSPKSSKVPSSFVTKSLE